MFPPISSLSALQCPARIGLTHRWSWLASNCAFASMAQMHGLHTTSIANLIEGGLQGATRASSTLDSTIPHNALKTALLLTIWGLASICTFKAYPWLLRSWRLRHLPTWKIGYGNLFLGNVDMLKPNHHLMLREAGKALGGIFKLRILTLQAVVLVDARLVNIALGSKEGLNKGIEPDGSDEMISVRGHRTLFSADTNGKHWKLIRKGTSAAFQFKNMRSAFPGVQQKIHEVMDKLHELGPKTDIDINNITMRFAMDVTGLVGFGKDYKTCWSFDDAGTDKLFDILRQSMLEAYKRALNPARRFLLFLPEVRSGRGLFLKYQQCMRELVAEVKARGSPSENDPSIAAHLLRLKDPDTGLPLSDDILTGEFGVYFTAGIESAGNAMSWTLFLMSQRPAVEGRVVKELDAAGLLMTPERPYPRKFELADMQQLPYFLCVCKEAMRVKPVASTGTTRVSKRDMQLGRYLIPAGTLIICPFDAVHHNELNWENADSFWPERWETPGAEYLPWGGDDPVDGRVKRFLPFSCGPRQCIGQSLAHMMHDVGLAMLLCHFSFRLAPKMGGVAGVEATEINRLTLQPGSGLWMNAYPRAKSM